MKDKEFKQWLTDKYSNLGTARSRIATCRLVEQYYPDLDRHFIKDKFASVLDALSYSISDERANRNPKHSIPIIGDYRTGSASLKQAVNLYLKFCISQNEKVVGPE